MSLLAAVACAAGVACSASVETTLSEPPAGSSLPVPSASGSVASPPPPVPTVDAAPPTVKDASVPDAAPAPFVATVGRWDYRDAAGPRAGWPGSKVRFRFRGTRADVTFAETAGRGGPSEWDVSVDGAWQANKLVTMPGKNTYAVAEALVSGEHTIELYRRTEAVGGSTQLVSVSFGQGVLLSPPPARRRTFEFLGDSLTNGYGIEGQGPQCPYSAGTQNFHVSFASRVAEAFSADEIGVAYQGKGLVKNYVRANTTLFPELYGRALPDDPTSLWDARKVVPDAVFVMIGANDYLQEKAQVFDPPNLAAYRSAYEALLLRIRQNAPLAYVFALVGPTQTDSNPVNYRARTDQTSAVTQAVTARTTAGDSRVAYVALPAEPASELSSCDFHPSLAVHDHITSLLVPEVRRITGF